MNQATRSWSGFGFLWLSLAIILVHALLPVGSPLARTSGSAFNGFTWEVALGPSRASVPERERRQREPGLVAGDRPGVSAVWLQATPRVAVANTSSRILSPVSLELGRPSSGPARAFQARGPPFPNG